MKKLRSALAVIALLATLSGPFFFQASGSLANVASVRHVGSSVALFMRSMGPCPVPGSSDC